MANINASVPLCNCSTNYSNKFNDHLKYNILFPSLVNPSNSINSELCVEKLHRLIFEVYFV